MDHVGNYKPTHHRWRQLAWMTWRLLIARWGISGGDRRDTDWHYTLASSQSRSHRLVPCRILVVRKYLSGLP